MQRDELLRLYPAHRGKLVSSLARLVGPVDAEDLAEETLLRAMGAVEGFRGDAALATWLHRIGVNLAYDLLRQRGLHPVVSETLVDLVPEAAADSAESTRIEQQQMSQCVRKLMAKLPSDQRDVLTQADMLERTALEIARDSGITAGNAKIRLHRARRAMKSVLETHCEFDRQQGGVLCCVPKTR